MIKLQDADGIERSRLHLEALKEAQQKDDLPRMEHNHGVSPSAVLHQFGDKLTDFEKLEIKNYQKIYCFGHDAEKIPAPENAMDPPLHGAPGDFFSHSQKKAYNLVENDHIDYRYSIDEIVWSHGYEQLIRATDCKKKKPVVIKICNKTSDLVYNETRKLMEMKTLEPTGKMFINLIDYDHFRSYHYLVFEKYDQTLRDYLREHRPNGSPHHEISKIAKTIFQALEFLKRHDIIHGNIAPKNFILNRSLPIRLKLSNFSEASYSRDVRWAYPYNTYHYRAPEVFCGCYANTNIDTWSAGCILAEMSMGKVFLEGESMSDQFYLILEVFNLPPDRFYDITTNWQRYFFSTLRNAPKHIAHRNGQTIIDRENYAAAENRLPPNGTPFRTFFHGPNDTHLRNFLTRIFKWLPYERISPEDALLHRFLA